MKMTFKTEIFQLLEILPEELTSDLQIIPKTGWDSLTLVSIIALIDKYFNKRVDTTRLMSCKTYNELLNLIGSVDAIEN